MRIDAAHDAERQQRERHQRARSTAWAVPPRGPGRPRTAGAAGPGRPAAGSSGWPAAPGSRSSRTVLWRISAVARRAVSCGMGTCTRAGTAGPGGPGRPASGQGGVQVVEVGPADVDPGRGAARGQQRRPGRRAGPCWRSAALAAERGRARAARPARAGARRAAGAGLEAQPQLAGQAAGQAVLGAAGDDPARRGPRPAWRPGRPARAGSGWCTGRPRRPRPGPGPRPAGRPGSAGRRPRSARRAAAAAGRRPARSRPGSAAAGRRTAGPPRWPSTSVSRSSAATCVDRPAQRGRRAARPAPPNSRRLSRTVAVR